MQRGIGELRGTMELLRTMRLSATRQQHTVTRGMKVLVLRGADRWPLYIVAAAAAAAATALQRGLTLGLAV